MLSGSTVNFIVGADLTAGIFCGGGLSSGESSVLGFLYALSVGNVGLVCCLFFVGEADGDAVFDSRKVVRIPVVMCSDLFGG